MKNDRFLAVLALCLVIAISLVPMTALAAGSIDFSQTSSLKIAAVYDKKPLSGMQFHAYLVSNVDEYGELTVTDRYKDYAEDLDIRGRDDESWQAAAQKLSREILLDSDLKPTRSAKADTNGTVSFTDLPMGLYLILGSTIEKESYVYSTSAFFVMLPEQNLTSNTWNYNVIANAKPEQEPIRANYKIIKVWEDDCHKNRRPKSITISLICDTAVYDTITLPHNGAWHYTWENLDTNHQWTVTEAKQEGYKDPEIQQEGNTFIVKNTCRTPKKITPADDSLPQTGQLWWPVPVLFAAGLLLIVIGLIRRRDSHHAQ